MKEIWNKTKQRDAVNALVEGRAVPMRSFGAMKRGGHPDLDRRTIPFTLVTRDLDAHGTIIEPAGIDLATRFQKNPIMAWAHDYSRLPIGRSIGEDQTDAALDVMAQFAPSDLNPFGDQVFRMYRAGFLNAVSIGFMPLEWDPMPETENKYDSDLPVINIKRAEMMEFSAVPIPSNGAALQMGVRALVAAGTDTPVESMDEQLTLDDFARALTVVEAGPEWDSVNAVLVAVVDRTVHAVLDRIRDEGVNPPPEADMEAARTAKLEEAREMLADVQRTAANWR